MDIYLHLGAHRSANQTFHQFLETNKVALAHAGIVVWSPKRTRDGLMRGLTRAPEKITMEDERQGIRSIGRMRAALEQLEREGVRAVLISDPNLLGDMQDNLSQTTLYPLVNERLMRLQPVFADRPLRVGLTMRSYEDYWTSVAAFGMALGRDAPNDDMLDFLTTHPRHWRHVVRDIAVAFAHAQVFVWPFERMAGRPQDMLQALCGNHITTLTISNDWLGRGEDLRQLNRSRLLLGQPPLGTTTPDHGARWMPFSREHQRVLRAEYRQDIAWLDAGAQGLAHYIDGRSAPAPNPNVWGQTQTATAGITPVEVRGHTDGIEKKLG